METRNSCAMIDERFLPLVEQCLLTESLNAQGGILEVKQPRASTLVYEGGRVCDKFILGIPYCGTHISWEVIFDRNHPGEPPDIIFSPKDEITDFCPNLENIPSLHRWSLENQHSLSNMIEELIAEYRFHHKGLVAAHQRLSFELNTLLESQDYSDADVHHSPTSVESHSTEFVTRFFVPLSLDCSAIPTIFTKENPGQDSAALVVIFPSSSSARPIPSLLLSPRIQRILGGCGELRLPQWRGDMACLMDYVPAVHKLLRERVETIMESYVQRKEYTAACLSIMGKAVLEYDTEDFKTLAFFFERLGFCFICRLNLSDRFPTEQPSLILQSVYHRLKGIPCLSVIKDYPYSPRWNADEMADRMQTYIISIASQFKELSQEKGEWLT